MASRKPLPRRVITEQGVGDVRGATRLCIFFGVKSQFLRKYFTLEYQFYIFLGLYDYYLSFCTLTVSVYSFSCENEWGEGVKKILICLVILRGSFLNQILEPRGSNTHISTSKASKLNKSGAAARFLEPCGVWGPRPAWHLNLAL